MKKLLSDIAKCTVCVNFFEHDPRPIVQADPRATIAIIGQAPGRKVHASGIPWDDPSGKRLREWMGIDDATFYNPKKIALIPMGFCYPGHGKSGDLPPRPECAPLWHKLLLSKMNKLNLILLFGQYAQQYYLKEKYKINLTETVRTYQEYLPLFLPLPHPSPRNQIWVRKHPWFETELIPLLQKLVSENLT